MFVGASQAPVYRNMDSSEEDDPQAFVKGILSTLRSTSLKADALVDALSRFLTWIDVLPISRVPTCHSPPTFKILNNFVPQAQQTLLTQVIVTWGPLLTETHQAHLIDAFFCPPRSASHWSGFIAVHAYASLCSEPISDLSIRLLSSLSSQYNIDICYQAIFEIRDLQPEQALLLWTDTVTAIFSVPGKVANVAGNQMNVPSELNHGWVLSIPRIAH